ncbi:hypothetical protein WS87_22980 [Burkholderia sp. MSMB0856]|uniref:hypothetical protein n=1 Tax=Burkholderia sp. MSMB0856 TaxID=1637869 RepID=UPI00075A0F42|nr:hypothetical protein [Burkholderia sp. MSMB0856]AOJ89539.1 hypothetical protein WS87_22980 [Burkholderia sp. MSMB0856]KVH34400.1 hypothetical protein WS87_19300 [Burkholderia sp. MSMB0856]
MRITQWVHLSEMHYDPWVLPIYTAWHRAVQETRTTDKVTLITDKGMPITEVGLHISTRLTLLPYIGHRLGQDLAALWSAVAANLTVDHINTPDKEAFALAIDNDRKYLVIADLHAMLFELNACIDAMKDFMHAVHKHVGQPITDKQRIRIINSWMQVKGIDDGWFSRLDSARNFVAHQGAFYLAFDTSAPQWDLLMVKRDTKVFNDPKTYVRFSDVEKIMAGFSACRMAMQAHLVSLLDHAT